jgi:hypothetical protein
MYVSNRLVETETWHMYGNFPHVLADHIPEQANPGPATAAEKR